jgi:hypothetical protein
MALARTVCEEDVSNTIRKQTERPAGETRSTQCTFPPHSANQNHPVERRKKVIRALAERGNENAQAIAVMMEAMLPMEV